MISEVKEELVNSIQPIVQQLTEKCLDISFDVAAAGVLLVFGALAISIFSSVLRRTLLARAGQKALLVRFGVSVAVKASWALLLVMVLGRLGVDVGPLIAGLGVTGFVLGFAFQESLGSFAAGLMIALNEPFKVGDYVSLAGHEGTILGLDMMAVVLATGDNRRITIPNKQAWGSPIVNFTALEMRRVDFAVGIAYGADIALARQTAVEVLAGLAGVLAEPAPVAEVKSLDDSAVALTCRAWVKTADYWPVFFAGNRLLKEAFDRAGVAIPFPQIDVHMVNN